MVCPSFHASSADEPKTYQHLPHLRETSQLPYPRTPLAPPQSLTGFPVSNRPGLQLVLPVPGQRYQMTAAHG